MGMQILVTPLSEVLHFVHMAMELEILDALVVYSNECLWHVNHNSNRTPVYY